MPVVLKTKEAAQVCATSTSVCWDHFYWLFLQLLCTCSRSHILSACQLPCSPLGLHVFLPSFLQQMLMSLTNMFCLPHVLLPVSQRMRFFCLFFPENLFTSASVGPLIFNTLKVYYTFFPLGAWCPPCRGHVQSSKTTLL